MITFKEYLKKELPRIKETLDPHTLEVELIIKEEEQGRELNEHERKRAIEDLCRGIARSEYIGKRLEIIERIKELNLTESLINLDADGIPVSELIEGLDNIAKCMGYSPKSFKDKAFKQRLLDEKIIYRGSDARYRAFKYVCDIIRKYRKAQKS